MLLLSSHSVDLLLTSLTDNCRLQGRIYNRARRSMWVVIVTPGGGGGYCMAGMIKRERERGAVITRCFPLSLYLLYIYI